MLLISRSVVRSGCLLELTIQLFNWDVIDIEHWFWYNWSFLLIRGVSENLLNKTGGKQSLSIHRDSNAQPSWRAILLSHYLTTTSKTRNWIFNFTCRYLWTSKRNTVPPPFQVLLCCYLSFQLRLGQSVSPVSSVSKLSANISVYITKSLQLNFIEEQLFLSPLTYTQLFSQ